MLTGWGWSIFPQGISAGTAQRTLALQMWRLRLSQSHNRPLKKKEVRLFHPVLGPQGPRPLCAVSFYKQKNFPSSTPECFTSTHLLSPFPVQYLGISMPLTLPY